MVGERQRPAEDSYLYPKPTIFFSDLNIGTNGTLLQHSIGGVGSNIGTNNSTVGSNISTTRKTLSFTGNSNTGSNIGSNNSTIW